MKHYQFITLKTNIYFESTNVSQGGDDTTPNALNFALLFLVRNRDVLKRVQLEIDLVLGSRCPTMEDREKMPYTYVEYTDQFILSFYQTYF